MSDVSRVATDLCVEFQGRLRSQAIVFAVAETRRSLLAEGKGDEIELLVQRSREHVIDLVEAERRHSH